MKVQSVIYSKEAPNLGFGTMWIKPLPSNKVIAHIFDGSWKEIAAGSSNYNELENKPRINNVELKGNLSLEDLGIPDSTKFVDLESNQDIEGTKSFLDSIHLFNSLAFYGSKRSNSILMLERQRVSGMDVFSIYPFTNPINPENVVLTILNPGLGNISIGGTDNGDDNSYPSSVHILAIDSKLSVAKSLEDQQPYLNRYKEIGIVSPDNEGSTSLVFSADHDATLRNSTPSQIAEFSGFDGIAISSPCNKFTEDKSWYDKTALVIKWDKSSETGTICQHYVPEDHTVGNYKDVNINIKGVLKVNDVEVVNKTTFDETIGNISTILDNINGEEI